MASHTRSSASFVIQPTQTSEVEGTLELFACFFWWILTNPNIKAYRIMNHGFLRINFEIYCIHSHVNGELRLISFHSSKIIHGRYPVPAYTASLSYYLQLQGFMHPKMVCRQPWTTNHQQKHQLFGWFHQAKLLGLVPWNLSHLNRGTSGPTNLEMHARIWDFWSETTGNVNLPTFFQIQCLETKKK